MGTVSRAAFSMNARPRRVLLASNGHGEDTVAGRLVDRLRDLAPPDVELEAWPMVGAGDAYIERGVALVGTRNELPSAGFATLSWRLLLSDLRAGWIDVHRRQWRDARAMRGRYDFAIAVGDVVPMLAAVVARTPFVFVGCAKSAYYGAGYGYTRFEKHLMRQYCTRCYTRDVRTAEELGRARVASSYLGNPMMDDLDAAGVLASVPNETLVVACLPGSHADAEANAARILSLVADAASAWEQDAPVAFIFAVAPRFDVERMWDLLPPAARARWRREPSRFPADSGIVLETRLTSNIRAQVVKDRLGDVLRRARVAIGLAGTANEQAIGLGVPLVTFATSGVQGHRYLRMKMRYFGPAAMQTAATGLALHDAVQRLARDEPLRARMLAEGRTRMGEPGASQSIARDILALIAARPGSAA